jgi:hypothetical protein
VTRSSRHGPRRQRRTRYEYDINAAPIVRGTGLTVRRDCDRPGNISIHTESTSGGRTVVDFTRGRDDLVRDDSHRRQLREGSVGDFEAAQGLCLILGQAADDKVPLGTG